MQRVSDGQGLGFRREGYSKNWRENGAGVSTLITQWTRVILTIGGMQHLGSPSRGK